MPALSLDCLTLTDSTPLDLVEAAAAAGFDLVSLWCLAPAAFPRQRLLPGQADDCARLLRDTGVGVHAIEVLDLASRAAVEASRPALELGARMGGKVATAYHGSNPDAGEVADLLARFVELAAEFGLGVVLEPVALARTRTLAQAAALIRRSGADAGILFDSLHHVRAGGGTAELRAIDPALIRYVQLNDGPATVAAEAMVAEAMGDRLLPGEGVFPLLDIVRLLPRDVPWAVEAPRLAKAQQGLSPRDQAIAAKAAIDRLLRALHTPDRDQSA